MEVSAATMARMPTLGFPHLAVPKSHLADLTDTRSTAAKKKWGGNNGGGKAYSDTYVDVNVYKRKHSAGIYGSTGTKSGFKGSGRGEAHAQSGISGSAGIGSGFGGHIGGFKKLH